VDCVTGLLDFGAAGLFTVLELIEADPCFTSASIDCAVELERWDYAKRLLDAEFKVLDFTVSTLSEKSIHGSSVLNMVYLKFMMK
jgi:hypothetical protein